MKNVTLSDIAACAGVSISTASRVLNHANVAVPISQPTRDRVTQCAKKLGYVPHGAARALRMGTSRNIGVLGTNAAFFLQHESQGSFAGVAMGGLIAGAVRREYHMTLLTGSESHPETGGVLTDMGLSNGLLVLNRDIRNTGAYLAALTDFSKPVVYVLDYPEKPRIHASTADDEGGARMAVKKLIEAGHQRIGFVRAPHFEGTFNRRQKGWQNALNEAGIAPGPVWTLQVARPRLEEIRASGVTAVVCAGDSIGCHFKKHVEAMGLKVPDDVGIVCFSFEEPGIQREHELAAVIQPLEKVVSNSVDMVVDLIEHQTAGRRMQVFPYRFREGASM